MAEKIQAPKTKVEPQVPEIPEIPDKPEKAPSSGTEQKAPQMPKEVEVGFHQGAITTLVNERNELLKMAQTVEIIMQSHVKRLEELGVKITKKQ